VLILAVDTSSPGGSLAVLKDTRTLGTVGTSTAEPYSSRMFRQLEFLLQELSVRMDDFDLFAAAIGPGSFTGLRVGLTAIKGWAEVYGKPIAAVSTLEAVATQSRSAVPRLLSVLDARRGQVYFGLYNRIGPHEQVDLMIEGPERVGNPAELIEQVRSGFFGRDLAIVTPVPELLKIASSPCETKRVAGRPGLVIEEVSAELAPHIGRLGLRHAAQGRLTDPLQLDANYVRRSDAEADWKAPSAS
jgi:tRNA threonylcarbamoyladenosine biosynthesis protein TsaB